MMEDDVPDVPAAVSGTLRNLSAWSVAIPSVQSYEDELKREKIPVFCIDVERNDRKEGEGVVATATPPPPPTTFDPSSLHSRSPDGAVVRLQAVSGILRPGVPTDGVPR